MRVLACDVCGAVAKTEAELVKVPEDMRQIEMLAWTEKVVQVVLTLSAAGIADMCRGCAGALGEKETEIRARQDAERGRLLAEWLARKAGKVEGKPAPAMPPEDLKEMPEKKTEDPAPLTEPGAIRKSAKKTPKKTK